ncbi:hypothetical protein [Kitasatospora sp. NBC_00315]|uniref:hypothetical protein n=1 Tax=Kitasatospora sp. NBC_00315 TaxID=2975963 RepID=UPI00324D429B
MPTKSMLPAAAVVLGAVLSCLGMTTTNTPITLIMVVAISTIIGSSGRTQPTPWTVDNRGPRRIHAPCAVA